MVIISAAGQDSPPRLRRFINIKIAAGDGLVVHGG
jgi:hypothetical protein